MSITGREVRLEDSETKSLTSAATKREYKLFVGLPASYGTTDLRYPAIYMLDGNAYFPTLTNLTRAFAYMKLIPETIVIGIGGPTLPEMFQQRRVDYSPVDRGAERFLQFIRRELIPFVEQHYRTHPDDRAFIGHSLGGFFGLYTLFHQPGTFQRYVIGSPPLLLQEKIAFTYEAEYASGHGDLPAGVFLFAGSLEELDDRYMPVKTISCLRSLAEQLTRRNYPGLDLQLRIFEDEGHVSVFPAALSRALRTVYGR